MSISNSTWDIIIKVLYAALGALVGALGVSAAGTLIG